MLMTESEAGTKWCMFARGDSIARERVVSRGDPPESHNRCISSACMAWEWSDGLEEDRYNQRERPEGEGWQPHSDSPHNLAWRRPLPAGNRKGFCGMVRQP